ncbi:MAG: 3-isopropylmalate dehydrogenase [Methylococcaceae bacterium]|nr:MAG: 3-isopropylmalate dehydrogenase [Methylococcaceae bacterium]
MGVLTGEGVGAEVIPVTLALLKRLQAHTLRRFELRQGGDIGKAALALHGASLTDEVVDFCRGVFDDNGAVLCGPGGERFVYELRARFDLFCKFTPLKPTPALQDTGVLRPAALENVDIVAVRENVGGLYFGEWGQRRSPCGSSSVYHHFAYHEKDVERILRVALSLARQRRGRLCVTVKPGGVPAISALWEEKARHLAQGYDVQVNVMEIDNAAYQLIANARQFDVLVSPNMFGDVLADCGALLLGSRGMSFSGNFSAEGYAVYQTGHGAAHDIAGSDRANPVGQIYSLAMLLRESFAWQEGAQALETAVATTLACGYRTPDVAAAGSKVVGTTELGRRIGDTLAEQLDGLTL